MSPKETSSKEQELQKEDLLTIHSAKEAEQPFQYSVGRYGSLFLEEMQERKRFVGARCPKCKKVYIPPREVCGPCFAKMEEAVEVGPRATLMTYTIIRFPYIDPETGDLRPVPFGYGFFQFDMVSASPNAMPESVNIIPALTIFGSVSPCVATPMYL